MEGEEESARKMMTDTRGNEMKKKRYMLGKEGKSKEKDVVQGRNKKGKKVLGSGRGG